MKTRLLAAFLVLVWVAIALYADTLFKGLADFRSRRFLGGAGLYLACTFLAVWTYRLEQWGWIVIAWNAASVAGGLVMSSLLFHETFTPRRAIATALALAAIFLAE